MKRKGLSKIRNLALAHGPIGTKVKGSKKGKRGYKRSDNKRIIRDGE